MSKSSTFNFTIYIRTTPKKLWDSLTLPKYTKQYWYNCYHSTDWQPGSSRQLIEKDGTIYDSGKIIEVKPAKRLIIKWRHEFTPEMKKEGYSKLILELTAQGKVVKLDINHKINYPNSKFIKAVSNGWPYILSSLKSLLETGKTLEFKS